MYESLPWLATRIWRLVADAQLEGLLNTILLLAVKDLCHA